mmetsp:Transcript_26339/g.23290  ORF Transcript_26339/g.23290 Transcript_26339/m.23290 type:complete len:182 (-) Transcript_26339:98-643(-)
MPEFERNESYGPSMKEPYNEPNKPYYHQGMSHVFLNECSYTIDKKKMNQIADKVDTFYNEIPESIKHQISFDNIIIANPLDIETDKLRDSSFFNFSRRRREDTDYNLELLNDMQAKIKSCDEISIEDLQLLIFLVQRTISDMKSVGRGGRGNALHAYELRRRGFQVNQKELLEFLEKMRYH